MDKKLINYEISSSEKGGNQRVEYKCILKRGTLHICVSVIYRQISQRGRKAEGKNKKLNKKTSAQRVEELYLKAGSSVFRHTHGLII